MASQGEQFIEKVTKLPLGQKIAVAVFVAGGLTAANFFLLVQPSDDETEEALKRMRKLEDEMIQNQAIANNLNQYRKEKELLEQQLAKALTELPEDSNVPEMIKSVYDIGAKSGLSITALEPKGENKAQFYAEIPFAMSVTGNYHEIAVFFDALSKLKRIVNVTGLKMGGPRVKNEKVLVDGTYMATTFRFLAQPKPEGTK